MPRNCKNNIGLSVHEPFDELCIEFGQNSCLENAMEVMVYYPADYEEIGLSPYEPSDRDDRVGPQVVIVRSVVELYTLLDEVIAGDYTRFNVTTKEDDENE